MSDENLKLDLGVEVHTEGEETILDLERSLQRLARQIRAVNQGMAAAARGIPSTGRSASPTTTTNASRSNRDVLTLDRASVADFRSRMTIQSRMASQRQREERESFAIFRAKTTFQNRAAADEARNLKAKATAEAQAFRNRFAFTSRMAKLAIAEERKLASERARSVADAARQEAKRSRDIARSIRENARLEAAENRRVDRERSARESARGRAYSSIRQGASDVREGAGRAVRGAGTMSAAAVAGSGAAVRRGISTRVDVESSETGISIFSGKTKAQIAEARRGFLDNEAIRNGLSVKEGLDVWSETLKAGIQEADKVTGIIMRGVAGLELNAKETTRLTALIDRNYGSSSTPEKLKSALNSVAVAAREDPTQSGEIIEGMKRGFGVMSTGNWTPEQLAAAVSGGQSVGIQPGKAGTFIGTAGKRMSLGASNFLGPKQRKELDYAAKEFGFANAKQMASAYSKDSFEVFMSSMRKLKAMAPDKAAQVSQALYGTQWSDEALQFSQGSDGVDKTYKEVIDPRNSNFLDEAALKRAESLQGRWNSTKAIFGRFWDAFGAGFEDILNSINQYFLELNSSFDYAKVKGYVSEFVEGVREAFGVSNWKELFANTFGGNLGNVGADIRVFGRGLADGILSIGRVIRSVMTVFGGAGGGAETIGRLSGQFVALSLALVALGPVVGILGGLASIVAGLAVAGRGLAGLAGLGAGAAGMGAAGAFRGIGLLLSKAFGLAVVAEIGANRGTISTWMIDGAKALLSAVLDGIKSAFTPESIQAAMRGVLAEMIPAPIQRWMESNGLEEKKALPGKTLDGLGKPPVPGAPAERGVLGKIWDFLSSSLIGSAHAEEFVPPPRSTVSRIEGKSPETQNLLEQKTQTPSIQGIDSISTVGRTPAQPPNTEALRLIIPTVNKVDDPQTQQIRLMERTIHSLDRLNETMQDTARFQRQSYQESGGGGITGILNRAAVLAGTTATGSTSSSRIMSGVTGGDRPMPSSGGGAQSYQFGPGPLANSVPGSALNGGGGLSRRGILGRGGNYSPGGSGSGLSSGMPESKNAFGGSNNIFGNNTPYSPGVGGGGNGSGPTGGLRDRMKSVYDAFRSTGLSHEAAKSFAAEIGRENDYNPNLMYGSHIDPHNRKRNAGMMSWQGDRATNLLNRLREGGHLNEDGSIKRTQGALNAQAQFAIDEMKNPNVLKNGPRALGILNNPNASHQDRALALGDDVIKWRQHDPRYASHAHKRDKYYNQMEGVSQGAQANIGSPSVGSQGGSAGTNIPGLGLGKGQYEGLRVKGQQAIGNGDVYKGVTDLARQAQENLPGGVKHFSAFNDRFHAGRNSKHNQGLAFDTTLVDGSKSVEAAEAMRNKMRSAGLTDKEFKVIDEYKNPSGHSTGGHIHSQFNTSEASKKYSDYIESLKGAATQLAKTEEMKSEGWKKGMGGNVQAIASQSPVPSVQNSISQVSQGAEQIKSGGWRPGLGGNASPLGAETSVPLGRDTPIRVGNTQQIGGGSGGAGGSASTTNNSITIQGAGQDAESIANAVQRKLNDKINRRTTDFSPNTLSV